MTHGEFHNERRRDNDSPIRLDTLVRENLKRGYAVEERFEEQLRRVDRAGMLAADIINQI